MSASARSFRCACDPRHKAERFREGDTNVTVKCTACGATWTGGKAPPPFEREEPIFTAVTSLTVVEGVVTAVSVASPWSSCPKAAHD